MNKYYGILFAALFLLTGCDPIESGAPPEIDGFTVTPRSDTQLEVSWKATDVSDDLIEASALHYGIWYAKTSDGLNTASLGTPTIVTKEGVLSYTITGLTANTSYEVLVRVADRGNVFSTNTNKQTKSTLAAGAGRFATAIEQTIADVPGQIIAGSVINFTDDIGFVYSNVIDWYTRNTTGGGLSRSATTPVTNAREAYLVPVTANAKDNLFVVTSSGLRYYLNNNAFDLSDMSFLSVPQPETFTYRLDNNVLDVFSYVASDGRALLYEVDPDAEGDDDPFIAHPFALGDANALFSIAKLDGDADYDLVYLKGNTLSVSLGRDTSLDSFEGADEIATLTSTDVGEGSYSATLFVERGDSDANFDIFLFVRNQSRNIARVLSWQGNGNGTFGNKRTADYAWHSYENPVLTDAGGDARLDLVIPQEDANNVAVYFGPTNDFNVTPDYYGIVGAPKTALTANLDGVRGPDLLVFDETAKKLHILYATQ